MTILKKNPHKLIWSASRSLLPPEHLLFYFIFRLGKRTLWRAVRLVGPVLAVPPPVAPPRGLHALPAAAGEEAGGRRAAGRDATAAAFVFLVFGISTFMGLMRLQTSFNGSF